ncbi:hypothetical protein [Streptomyces sp. NBC_00483]|uniref:hypothetical protein n=1 Tax=Streptomyces sp. NBC_00483 TaxID=2975756 RepID=UPI002E16F3DE
MIRIVTAKRLARLEADTHAAFERARQATEAANTAATRHMEVLAAANGRAERAEESKEAVGEMFAGAVAELSAAQEELLLQRIELRRLGEELAEAREPGRYLYLLRHYGEPWMIYSSQQDAFADTATHGVPANRVWVRAGEQLPSESEWRLSPFTYDAGSNAFRGEFVPVPRSLGEAA